MVKDPKYRLLIDREKKRLNELNHEKRLLSVCIGFTQRRIQRMRKLLAA